MSVFVVCSPRLGYYGYYWFSHMKHSEVNTVADFHEMVRKHWDSTYFFRGEDSDKYELRPKFGRDQVESGKNTSGVERGMFDDFKRFAIPHFSYNPQNEWDWLAIAQHHGLHTRLLDWTENPLAAAYFSVCYTRQYMRDSVVYIFKSADLPDVDERTSPSPFEIKNVMLFHPRSIALRITAQSGLFTVHPKVSDIFDVPSLERVVIKGGEWKGELMGVLLAYNVNHFTMFPDLDGLARFLTQSWVRP